MKRRSRSLGDMMRPSRDCAYEVRVFGGFTSRSLYYSSLTRATKVARRTRNASVNMVCPGQRSVQTILKCHRGKCLSHFTWLKVGMP